jgi:hypothetical protein
VGLIGLYGTHVTDAARGPDRPFPRRPAGTTAPLGLRKRAILDAAATKRYASWLYRSFALSDRRKTRHFRFGNKIDSAGRDLFLQQVQKIVSHSVGRRSVEGSIESDFCLFLRLGVAS